MLEKASHGTDASLRSRQCISSRCNGEFFDHSYVSILFYGGCGLDGRVSIKGSCLLEKASHRTDASLRLVIFIESVKMSRVIHLSISSPFK